MSNASLTAGQRKSHLICKNFTTIAKAELDSCSYKLVIGPYGISGYAKEYVFNEEVKNARTKKIREYEKNMSRHDTTKRQGNKNRALKSIEDAHDLAGKESCRPVEWNKNLADSHYQ